MVRIRILTKRNINSLIRKIPYWRMPIGIRIIGVFKKTIIHSILKERKKLDIN
jgi:hypothetical protein